MVLFLSPAFAERRAFTLAGWLKNSRIIICFWHGQRAELVYLRLRVGLDAAVLLVKLFNTIRYADQTALGKQRSYKAFEAISAMVGLSKAREKSAWKVIESKLRLKAPLCSQSPFTCPETVCRFLRSIRLSGVVREE